MSDYWRPVPIGDAAAPGERFRLAGGWVWFRDVERLERGRAPEVLPANTVPAPILERLTAARPPVCGVALDQPRIMGVLNTTPDSFSDGGDHFDIASSTQHAAAMARYSDFIDVGGESTRPGAALVSASDEIARTVPVISAMRAGGLATPVSIDTRKPEVAEVAVRAGASLYNDVSALTFSPNSLATAARLEVPVCLMHAQGDPATMQDDPRYDDVLLDVYDFLDGRISAAVAAGLQRRNLIVDPGIGFGKSLDHNLAILRRLSLFHGLGCPILLGVSRKRFIGTIGEAPEAKSRGPGSLAVALDGLRQGVQILRVHDVAETRQALRLFCAMSGV